MNMVCEVCGDIGYKQLLICCRDCKDSAAHQYCFDKVIFDGSLADWLCFECQQRRGEVMCRRSLEKVSSERPSHAHSGSTLQHPIAKRMESAMDAGPWSNEKIKSGMTKYASTNNLSSSEMNSRPKKHIRKKSNVRTTGNHSNRKRCNTIAKGLHSCETIGTETTKDDNAENQQVDDENSVCSLNFRQPAPLIVSCLGYALGDKAIERLDRNSKRTPESLRAQFKGLLKKTNNKVLGSKSKTYSPATVHGNSVLENGGANLSSKHTDQDNRAYLSSSLETYQAKSLPEDSTAELEISVDFGKDNPRKRRHFILLDDDDDEEEKAEDVHLENVNPLSQKFDTPKKNKVEETVQAGDLSVSNASNGGPVKKRRRYVDANEDEDEEANKVEETVQTGDLSDSDASNGGPVKKRRRYIDANGDEDEEAVIDIANASSAQNDVANFTLNDGANLESQTAVAEEHPHQSRIDSDSDTAGQQYYIYSRPIDEPVWSGAFKINCEVFGKLDAHLSNKACKEVWDLSRMLQPVVEVMKIPRWQAWPKRWTSAAPTDDCIGLFFFLRSSRLNEEPNKLLNEIIESDDALKVTIGVVELLIFPSTLLSEQIQLFQGKYYLWGVFKRRKDKSDRGVLVGEQDGVACATEESKLQEQHVLYQQDDIRCESSGQETSVVKHVVHVENEIMVERNFVAQKVAMKIAKRKGITLPDSKLPYAMPNSPEDGSKCYLHPRIDGEFHAPEEMNQHEEYLSSPVLNASSVTKSTTKCGHGESHSGSGPPTTKLFGLVTARTPRAQQLIEEMISEGALVFSVPGHIETTESCTGSDVGVCSGLNPDTDYQHLREHPQSFHFISTGHGVPDVASEACLELFPVRQENIGWAPRVESTKEVDLDLSLGARSRAPSVQL